MKTVTLGNIVIGAGHPVVLIAGPCVIESEESTLRHAKAIKEIAGSLGIPFIFKSSYDKANRTSVRSYRGPGIKTGLGVLKKVKDELDVPVLSDVHTKEEARIAGEVLDIIQIPALLSRQTDLITEAARTGKAVNIKKGQFSSPWDVKHALEKVQSAGNPNVLITERGTSFGYNNLVSDFRSILIMQDFGVPVIYDASHSVQMPGGLGEKSGGDSRFIPPLMLASVSAGADGIFVEVHEDPDNSPCDGPNMLSLKKLEDVLRKIKEIERIIKR